MSQREERRKIGTVRGTFSDLLSHHQGHRVELIKSWELLKTKEKKEGKTRAEKKDPSSLGKNLAISIP